jgi:hypothetical protein
MCRNDRRARWASRCVSWSNVCAFPLRSAGKLYEVVSGEKEGHVLLHYRFHTAASRGDGCDQFRTFKRGNTIEVEIDVAASGKRNRATAVDLAPRGGRVRSAIRQLPASVREAGRNNAARTSLTKMLSGSTPISLLTSRNSVG